MGSTVPANAFVQVNPEVLSAGGLGIVLNGILLTESTRVPIGQSLYFANAANVSAYFGPNSTEAALAATYFAGFTNSNIKPGNIGFTQYPGTAVGAYLRGGPITGLTLAQLGALSGSLTVIVDGYTHTAASVNLSGCTSYSNAAAIIQTALTASEPQEATATQCTIAGTVLTVGGTITGTFAVGQTITGSGVTAGSIITSLGTGTGGTGTYNLSASSTIASPEAITASATAPTVTFDSISGGFVIGSGITGAPSTIAYATGTIAASLFLTLATGAVTSQGAAATTPAAFMTALAQNDQQWTSFMTVFDPDGGSGNTLKLAFAEWTSQQNNEYLYVCWDTDATVPASTNASTSLGQILKANASSGTFPIYRTASLGDGNNIAAFVCGAIASVDFTQKNGRTSFAYKGQAGLAPDITNQTAMNNIIANGYSCYVASAKANNNWTFLWNGQISGGFTWLDSFINQQWLNANFQIALLTMLTQLKSIPYNSQGYALVEASVGDVIAAGLNFGAYSPGVVLSSLEQAEVNNAAGFNITSILNAVGYYFQVLPATASQRGARTSPPCNFWYCDAGSIQLISLASIALL